nr:MAG TPA: hypothetical protein [Caudoviricetes sp.]
MNTLCCKCALACYLAIPVECCSPLSQIQLATLKKDESLKKINLINNNLGGGVYHRPYFGGICL